VFSVVALRSEKCEPGCLRLACAKSAWPSRFGNVSSVKREEPIPSLFGKACTLDTMEEADPAEFSPTVLLRNGL